MSAGRLIGILIGCALGNFAYQAFTGENYPVATERTFFQGGALFAAWLSIRAERIK